MPDAKNQKSINCHTEQFARIEFMRKREMQATGRKVTRTEITNKIINAGLIVLNAAPSKGPRGGRRLRDATTGRYVSLNSL